MTTGKDPRLHADLSTLDDGFGHWLAGFVDGEGSFVILKDRSGAHARYGCVFTVALRADDLPILEEIHARVGGIGTVYPIRSGAGDGNPQSAWKVFTKSDALALSRVFDQYPLRAKKADDFRIWREAVYEWHAINTNRRGNWTRIEALRDALVTGRQYNAATDVLAPAVDDRQQSLEV